MSEENTYPQDGFASSSNQAAESFEAPTQTFAPDPYQGYYAGSPQYAYQQPIYAQPAYYPPAPQTELSGGPKVAWFFIGFLGGIIGILLAYATNVDKAPKVKSDAVKFSAIGLGAQIVLSILFVIAYFAIIIAFLGLIANTIPGTYY
jgi:hypothetical protein